MSAALGTLGILDRLIAFPTVSADSNLDLIDWTHALLRDAGASVTRIPAPCGTKAGLLARIGPAVEGGICLSAHSDVVPVEGQNWTKPAFQLMQEGDRVFGRGTTDMKGFLASALSMMLQASTQPLRAPVQLALSYDEEVGCVGIQHMQPALKAHIPKPRAVIVGEPTSMRPAIGHKGKTALRVTCRGEAGHSALAPRFTNAIHVAAAFVDEVRKVQDRLALGAADAAYDVPYSTVHVGQINGGRALNIVPDRTELKMEIRFLPDTSEPSIRRMLDDAADAACRHVGGTADICIEETNAYPGFDIPFAHPGLDLVRPCLPDPAPCKVAFGTEAGVFAQLGWPTLVIGPGDMQRDGHRADEGLDLPQLEVCDRFLADLAKQCC